MKVHELIELLKDCNEDAYAMVDLGVKSGRASTWTAIPMSDLRLIADSQAAEIERLRGELDECRQLLSTAEDAWECGAWNSLIGMQQLYLTRSWYEAARKVTNEYDD